MRTEQRTWGDAPDTACQLGELAQLVMMFGSTQRVADEAAFQRLRAAYPKAHIVGASTAGEIQGTRVSDDGLVSTAIAFDTTKVRVAEVEVSRFAGSAAAGQHLAKALAGPHLAHILVFSDGQRVNGSELAKGLQAALGNSDVAVTGGLAGDGARFQRTVIVGDDGPHEGRIVAVGLYGDGLRVGYGSLGGWDPFGPERVVTKSRANVLYELDGQPALALYKRYLGEHAAGLPATGLLFPLSITVPATAAEPAHELVRTILAVSEQDQSLTFAGDIPEGAHARLMKANFDRLVEGAHGAAVSSHGVSGAKAPELALLISCVGRKLVLKQRTEQELDAVRDVLGAATPLAGFYSYGEICPSAPHAGCELHNQTMTITTFREAADAQAP